MEHADTGLVCQALPTLPVQARPRRGCWSLGPALPPLPLLRFARTSVRPRGPAQPCRHMHEGSRPATASTVGSDTGLFRTGTGLCGAHLQEAPFAQTMKHTCPRDGAASQPHKDWSSLPQRNLCTFPGKHTACSGFLFPLLKESWVKGNSSRRETSVGLRRNSKGSWARALGGGRQGCGWGAEGPRPVRKQWLLPTAACV